MESAGTPVWRIDWTDELSVDNTEMDTEHRRFIALVNSLNEAILWRMELKQIKERMQAIVDDAMEHFAHEEALLKEWGHPDAEEHAKIHAQILADINEIMGRFGRDESEYAWIEAGLKLKHMLIEHLLTEDMKYRDFRRTM
ncbi:MAG: sensory transduction histidine kinase [Gallionellaceae bacterium]|nr:MAG: sensory transduction histidine kinase [Gallionellaceae bacterium]